MMISTKGRYALRIMLDLAGHDDGTFISLKQIATRQNISMKYLEMIVALLHKGGVVKSQRGKEGGEPDGFGGQRVAHQHGLGSLPDGLVYIGVSIGLCALDCDKEVVAFHLA